MIDTITIDLWNTLISNTAEDARRFHKARTNGIVEAFVAEGMIIEEEQVGEALDLCYKRCWDSWTKNVDLTSQEQMEILMSLLPGGAEVSPYSLERIEKAYTEAVMESPPALIEGSAEILDYLEKQDYKLGLICNTGRSPGRVLRKLLKQHRVLHYFDVLTFSDELRIRKPDPRIFLLTLKKLESSPSDSVHIGDELQTDVIGAKGAGMTAILFDKGRSGHQEIQSDYCVSKLEDVKRIVESLRQG